ncbi:MAG: 50S ribosomal protein L18 [Holosporaceae bacterium]|jgi:large subunit ribosomal protein L18|nr:50S ribosomal protein L18 [Holosporaceae bacterium]
MSTRFDRNFVRRTKRERYRVKKTSQGKPRLSVFRSTRNIYAQIIDDTRGCTLCSASSLDKEVQGEGSQGGREVAGKVGEVVAIRAQAAGIGGVVFDRGGYNYHGRVKLLADGARRGGLLF